MARACGSYPQCPRFESRCRYQKAQHIEALLRLSLGPLVKWLRHRPFTAVTWVRVPYGSPKKANPNQLCGAGSDLFIPGSPRRRSLRTAQKNQSLKAAGFSSAVLRVSFFSPCNPLRWACMGFPFVGFHLKPGSSCFPTGLKTAEKRRKTERRPLFRVSSSRKRSWQRSGPAVRFHG